MTTLDLIRRGRLGFLPVAERIDEDLEAARRVGVMPGRMQPVEVRMRQNLNGYAARAARRSAIWFMPHSPRRRDASAQRGDCGSRGERGAEASNIAIRR